MTRNLNQVERYGWSVTGEIALRKRSILMLRFAGCRCDRRLPPFIVYPTRRSADCTNTKKGPAEADPGSFRRGCL